MESPTIGFRERGNIPWCRALPTQERGPVIGEITKVGGNFQASRRHSRQLRPGEHVGQAARPTDGKTDKRFGAASDVQPS